MQVNILEAKNRLSELVKCAQASEEIVIARRGVPITRLVPVDTAVPIDSHLGNGTTLLSWLQSRPVSAPVSSDKDIEAAIQDMRDDWE